MLLSLSDQWILWLFTDILAVGLSWELNALLRIEKATFKQPAYLTLSSLEEVACTRKQLGPELSVSSCQRRLRQCS